MSFWSKIDVVVASVVMGMIVLLLTQVLVGCSHIGSKRLRKMDVDCTQCEVKLVYDLEDDDKHLEIKGL